MRRAYPKYRDSGDKWLGDVPEHWDERQLRWSADLSGNIVNVEEVDSLPYVGLENIASWTGALLSLDREWTPESVSSTFGAEDVLFGKLRPYLAKGFSPQFEGLCSTEFLVLTPSVYKQDFLLYLLLTPGFVSLVDSSTFGAKMPRANWNYIGKVSLPLPPLAEQHAIAAFLDSETTRIDKLVEKNRLLIERLAEYRTAMITRAVTRGLDPSAPLRPSGVEWLGDIPEHWEVRRLSTTAGSEERSFTDGDWVELPYIRESGIRLIQTGNVGVGEYVEQGFRYIDEEAFDELGCTEVKPGDVLICRLADPVGRACLAPDLGVGMITSVDVCILKPSGCFDGRHLVFVLSSRLYLQYVDSLVRGGTRDRISRSMLGTIAIPSPALDEQRAIADYLDRETKRIDALTSRAETAIERLQEYRAALITAAVTGKIDVREPE